MPHLSPMQWTLALILFWLMLLILMSVNWWSQSPTFKSQASTSTTLNKKSSWTWL